MLFPTVTFALFFFVVLPTSWLLMPARHRWKIFILAASYFFYGYWNWRFVFLLGLSTVANFAFARTIHSTDVEQRRRLVLTGAVVFNLGLLGYFKYADFFVQSSRNTLEAFGLDPGNTLVNVTLPIGISFFTFQALSYVIDVYRREFEPGDVRRLRDVTSRSSPRSSPDPSCAAASSSLSSTSPRTRRRIDASRAFFLIFIGLFKKVVIANYSGLRDRRPGLRVARTSTRRSSCWSAVYGYAVQIYADFSGYTDIAIGLALLLGFRFPQNFDSPYTRRRRSRTSGGAGT